MKVCLEPGCPTLTPKSRCDRHRRERERARGTRQERGYAADHDRLRAEWAPLVSTGNVKCWRCAEYIPADAPFDLGHDDQARGKYRGPEHVACNRATAGRSQR